MSSELSNMDGLTILHKADLDILEEVDLTIEQALTSGDMLVALEYGRALKRNMQVRGLALAKLLAKLSDHYDQFQAAGVDDEFENVIQTELGISPQTVRKYVSMWKAIFENNTIPENIRRALMGRPVRSLILLTAGANENQLDWQKVLAASNTVEIANVVRNTRGLNTSARTRVVIMWKRETGDLIAYRGDEQVNIGTIYRTLEGELAKKAIDRIMSSGSILEE